MKGIGKLVLTVHLAVLCGWAQAGRATTASDDPIFGIWRGHSTCMVKDSPCHDEINIYRISRLAGKPGLITVTGGKIVDGKEVVMGSGEWKYDMQKHTLDSPNGDIHLTIEGDKLEGALTLPDHTVYRRIYLKKEN